MRARPQDDAGSTHVLEAVIMASIMVSAVAYVATFESPTSATAPTRDQLKQKAMDALAGLYDTPVADSSFGENALSVLLAQCMGGNCTSLEDKLDQVLPKGASYAVYISNGYSTFPVYVPADPRGEAVTATQLLEPKWSHSFVTTGTSNVNPASDSLTALSLPVFNSNTLSQGGSPLRVIVHGTRMSDGANYTVTGFFSTQAVSTADAGLYPAVSMTFLGKDGKPGATRDVSATTAPAGVPTGANVPFTVRINETAGVTLPKGTELTISMPRGWTGIANQTVNMGNWTVLANATDANSSYASSDVVARLTKDVTNASVNFVFNASFKGDVLDWYAFQARLSKGALSEANMLVRGKATATSAVFAVPQMGMSVPRPMGATATTTWTLFVDVPVKADESITMPNTNVKGKPVMSSYPTVGTTTPSETPSDTGSGNNPYVVIDRIEVIEQDGARIFGAIQPVSGSGAWAIEGDRLVWTGNHTNANGPLSLAFTVNASGVAGAATSKNPFVPPVLFDAYKSRLMTQIAPGFYRGTFLPESADGKYPGYRNTERLSVGTKLNFTSDSIYKSTLLPGTGNYTLNPLPSFQDSIHGSYVNVERRNVALDGTVVISADVQSLLFALSQAGISAGVDLHVYPPWVGDDKTPIWSQENLDSGLLNSDVTKMAVLDLNGDGYPDVAVGTSNGRVLALDGLTGKRLQGTVFTAPLSTTGLVNGTVTAITHLSPYKHLGQEYLVVGTDEGGKGIYVLDKQLQLRWRYDKPCSCAVVSMDASADVDGGGADIVVGLENSGVYVMRPPNPAEEAEDGPVLQLRKSQYPADEDDALGALYTTKGSPAAVVGLEAVGPNLTRGGVAVTFQSNPDVILNVDYGNPIEGETTFGVTSLPRSGFQAVDNTGKETWTFFGSPVTVARSYDYDGDAATDIVGGSPAGYVYMMNGLTATQPLYSQVYYPATSIRDADAHDAFNAVFLTTDGQARVTTTGWNDHTCAYCSVAVPLPTSLFPKARGIALNASHSFWVVGIENTMMRTTPGSATLTGDPEPQYPQFVVVTPTGTKGGLSYLPEHQFDFQDVHFRWAPRNDEGWVVAGPCVGTDCDESLVMRTTDGGQNWIVYGHDQSVLKDGQLVSRLATLDDTVVDETLTRVNFTSELVGWIVGTGGTLLRTTDGGESWRGVATPTTDPLLDVACDPVDPDFCILVSAAQAWRTKNALAAHASVSWDALELDLTASLPATNVTPPGDLSPIGLEEHQVQSRGLRSVGVVNGDVAYIGGANSVFKTHDGGNNWTSLPMNYLEADANRVVAFQDGRGFVFGGNASHARVFFLHDYAMESRAQTEKLFTVPEGKRVVGMQLTADYSFFERFAYADFLASANGGENWQSLAEGPTEGVVREEGGLSTYVRVALFSTWFDDQNEGTDPRLRIDFHSSGDYTLLTAQVRNPVVKIILANAQNQTSEVSFELDLADPAVKDAENTTAVWDAEDGVLHHPLVTEYWTRNVSGEVRAIETGLDVSGDDRHEIWVATGGVLAANSPAHLMYAGSDLDKFVKNDNRVYLLDGKNGSVIARTASFPGNVTHLRLTDADDDGKPEMLLATTWDAGRSNGTLVALDPDTLELYWTVYLDLYQAMDLAAGVVPGDLPIAIVGTSPPEAGPNAIPGKVFAFQGDEGDVHWGAVPDQQGRYVISKKIPTEWFFGPYVVEVTVRWTNELHEDIEGVAQTREVLQTARFHDYFLVTPPDALAPPSPVYQVHLVTWFDEWT